MKRQIAFLSTVALTATLAQGGAALPISARADTGQPSHRFSSVPRVALEPLGRMVALAGSLAPAIRTSRPGAGVESGRVLPLTISLRVRNQAGLDALVRQEYTPGSSVFHHWLKPAQFAQRFAPLPAQREQIASWLRSNSIRITGFSRNGLGISASATASQLEHAFRTPILYLPAARADFFRQ